MQMFADFQINQRKLTERVIELEAANKALTALQFVRFFSTLNFFPILF